MTTSDGEVPARRRRVRVQAVLRFVLTAVMLMVVYYNLPLGRSADSLVVLLAIGLVGLVALLAWQVRAVVAAPFPRLRALEALGTAVLFFLTLFAGTYLSVSQANPASFTESLDHTDALYFAVTVLATVGFGDIAPISGGARLLVTVQMVCGLVLVGVVVKIFLGAVKHRLRDRDVAEGKG